MTTKHIIFGAAGCGKTFYLVNKAMPELFNSGYGPSDICFCSFTKAAAEEAKERTLREYPSFKDDDVIYFSTIHSICYRRLCMGKKVISIKLRKEFFHEQGIDYIPIQEDEDLLVNDQGIDTPGNRLLGFYDRLRVKFCKSITEFNNEEELKTALYQMKGMDSLHDTLFVKLNSFELLKRYEMFKYKHNVIDFIDMLLIAYKTQWIVPTKILIIDEFQDLSPLQYEIYKLWCRGKDRVYLAGDDNQAIFQFMEASAKFLLNERKNLDPKNGDTELVLPMTHRMKKKIHDYCQNYVKNIREENRVVKDVVAKDEGGEIVEEFVDESLERVLGFIRPGKETYILFRTNYYKKTFIQEVLIPHGIVYYEIRGQSLWNSKTIHLFNACVKLINKKPLDILETRYLIENVIYKLGLLERGAKAHFKASKTFQNEYSMSDLFKLGFSPKIMNFLEYEKLFEILDITETVFDTFMATPKNLIKPPIKLKIGTIHSAKGKQCDDCIIFKDVSKRIADEMVNIDAFEEEIRVFYVGQSRPKERLVILRNGFKNARFDLVP